MSSTANTKRNRWLLGALGAMVLFYFGDMAYTKLYEEPTVKSAKLEEQLTKKIQASKLALAKSKRAAQQLEQLEQKSLPWDSEMARSRYQAWLLQLAKDAKLKGTSVDSNEPVSVTKTFRGSKKPILLSKRFGFSLRGRGDLGQVTKFLYEFYRGGHLHKIRTMNLNPVGQGQEVDLSISIEALALPNADREAELTSLVSEELALHDVRDYQLIARRNFFGRGGTHSAWKQIRLSAVTSDVRGVGEAWFKVADLSNTVMLPVGQSLARSSFDILVVSLDDSSATVSVDGQLYRIAIGQSLADAVPVTK